MPGRGQVSPPGEPGRTIFEPQMPSPPTPPQGSQSPRVSEVDDTSGLPRFPLLSGLYHVVPRRDGVIVGNAGRRVLLTGVRGTGHLHQLVAACDGHTSLEDLVVRFGRTVALSAIRRLSERGMLEDAEIPVRESTAEILFATAFGAGSSVKNAAAGIANATVLVAGCGAVGSSVAALLAKAGISRLILHDYDDTSQSDISTGPVMTAEWLGRNLAAATGQLCSSTGTAQCRVICDPTLAHMPSDSIDFALVELGCGESTRTEDAASWCLSRALPFLPYSQDGASARVGPLIKPGGSPCHRCIGYRSLTHSPDVPGYFEYREHRARVAPRIDVFMASQAAIMAGFIALEATRAICKRPTLTARAALQIDWPSMSLSLVEIFPVPGCDGCARSQDSLSHAAGAFMRGSRRTGEMPVA